MVSSSAHHTNLMFQSASIFYLSSGRKASVDIKVFMNTMIYSPSLFQLHFSFIDTLFHLSQAQKSFCIFFVLSFFNFMAFLHSFFNAQLENVHENNWMETQCDLQLKA